MISCSHCGTQNRDGSKFCSNCGARLVPQSGLICPMCGTANKLESVFCSNCGARLVPLIAPQGESKPVPPATPIKGLSLPAKPYDPAADVVEEPKSDEPAEVEDDWLARLREKQTEQEHPIEDEDVPDWLKPSAPSSEDIQPIVEAERPSWLSSLPAESEQPIESPFESRSDAIPDWLKSSPPPTEPGVAAEPPPPSPTISKPTPEIETPTPAPSEELPAGVSEPQPPVTETTKVTTLAQLAAELEAAAPGEPLIEALEEKTVLATPKIGTPTSVMEGVEEIPDWLRGGAESDAKPQPTLAEMQVALPEEVPDWIAALKPSKLPASLEDEPLETVGPFAGLRGVLPLAIAITEPHPAVKPPSPQVQRDSAAIFETLAAPAGATPISKSARRAWSMRPLIYLLLALAVLIPFFLPSDWASSAVQISNTPTSELFDTIQGVPANSTVLLAFEYDPSVAGEMNLQAKALTRHLIQRNIKIITLSTFETGAPIARKIVADAARGTAVAQGVNYAHLGFLAGREAGLVNLATNGLTTSTLGVRNLRDVQLIVVFAGTDDALKVWMEQVQPRINVRIVAGVSAAVEPRARVYRDTPNRQLHAFTSGLVGAAQYEVLSQPAETGLALVSVNAQTAAQLLVVFVIGLGNLVHWLTRGQERNG